MRKLYWKIFIWFWFATIVTIIAVALLSSKLTQHSSNRFADRAIVSSIYSGGLIMLEHHNLKQLQEWGTHLHNDFNINLILYPVNPGKIIPKDFPTELRQLLNKLRTTTPSRGIQDLPYLISPPVSNPNGTTYRLIIQFPKHITEKFSWRWPDITLKLIIAFLISGLICYILSLYLSRPIRVLQRAARRLGRGELNTRVGKELHARQDEIAELAFEFDDMASRLQSLIQSRQQLLHDISHELRSPLARLSVALEIARRKDNNPLQLELNRIEKECGNLNTLISKILSFASLTERTENLHFTEVNLEALIQGIIEDAHYETQGKHTQIALTKSAPLILEANVAALKSAIENIIRNAIRYAPEQSDITVELEKGHGNINITIKDAGPGIPEDQISQIFDPFYRVDASRATHTGGFGLGLAIAKKAIALHHGKITAENIEPTGLAVTITLPNIGHMSHQPT